MHGGGIGRNSYLVAKLCPTLCNNMDCSLPGSSVHGILQDRIPEWIDISPATGSSRPRDQTCISCTAGRFFTSEPPGKPMGGGGTNQVQMEKAGSIRGFIKEDILLSALEQRAGIPEMGKSTWSICGRTISK